MVDLKHLRNKTIVIKIGAMPTAISGFVVNEESEGLWIGGSDFVAEIGKTTSLPMGIKTPAFFVPFAQIQWLMASQDY